MKKIIIIVFGIVIIAVGVYFALNQNKSQPAPTTQTTPLIYETPYATPAASTSGKIAPPIQVGYMYPYEYQTPAPVAAPYIYPTPATPPVPAPKTYNVTIQNFSFDQTALSVKKGDTVIWTNKDSAPHTVTGNSGGPSSGTLNTNATYSFTFTSAGTFNYHCSFHPSMVGTVTVTE